MFSWSQVWSPLQDDKLRLYLERELAWELAENSEHVLTGRGFEAIGWIPGYDDLLLRLDGKDEFAWVHLAWSRENHPQWPHCQLLPDVGSVNWFIATWDSTVA